MEMGNITRVKTPMRAARGLCSDTHTHTHTWIPAVSTLEVDPPPSQLPSPFQFYFILFFCN